MSILSLKLGNISSINCGSRSAPVCRLFSLLEDSFIISKHSVSLTEKEQFGGIGGGSYRSRKQRYNVSKGRDKFFQGNLLLRFVHFYHVLMTCRQYLIKSMLAVHKVLACNHDNVQ